MYKLMMVITIYTRVLSVHDASLTIIMMIAMMVMMIPMVMMIMMIMMILRILTRVLSVHEVAQ